MIYGYIRVSSDKQTVENQRFEIKNFCDNQNIKIDGWIEEPLVEQKPITNVNSENCSIRYRKMI